MQINLTKTALRSLWRNRKFSAINLAGLTIGISVFLLLAEFVAFEYQSNRFNQNFDRKYRFVIVDKEKGASDQSAPGIAPILKQKFPSLRYVTRIAQDGLGGGIVAIGDSATPLREPNISFVDDDFFQVFNFGIVAGTASMAAPNTVALSAKTAAKLFGNENPIGQTIRITNQFGTLNHTVGLVFKNPPANSDVHGDMFISLSTLANAANRNGNDWADPTTMQSDYTQIYVELSSPSAASSFEKQATDFLHASDPESQKKYIALQPLNNLHLAPSLNYELNTYGSLPLVLTLLAIAILILVIAWVNYINLSSAQAINRTKEVGIRKVLGASRRQLIVQYLAETILLTSLSCVLAIGFTLLLQKSFNHITGRPLSLSVLINPLSISVGIALVLISSILSGMYVAFVTSAFNPADAIRKKTTIADGAFPVRKSLLVFQFGISIVFIIATLVIYRQLQFMQTSDLGMSVSQKLVVTGPSVYSGSSKAQARSFKNMVAELPFVEKIAASNNIPGQGYNFFTDGIGRPNATKEQQHQSYAMLIVDQNYFNTYDIPFLSGRTFTSEDADKTWNKSHRVIINERAARELGFAKDEQVVGKTIQWGESFEIIGVIKDYHHKSLQEDISPTIFLPASGDGYFTIVTKEKGMTAKVAAIGDLYRKQFPGNPFEYFFADEHYALQYQQQQQLGALAVGASIIAVFIACLGLFGLTAFTLKQRFREIGIRKVLGAQTFDILQMISTDFLKLISIGVVIGAPIAWWSMNKWLQAFVFRINMSLWMVVFAGILLAVIALATIFIQAAGAARANPALSLKSEA
jgi:putative ABC transport system permease protein